MDTIPDARRLRTGETHANLRHGSEPFSLQRRALKGGTTALEGWGFRNETDPLTDVLLGSPAPLRHLSTSSLSRKHLHEAPCTVQAGQTQHGELVSAYEHFGVKVHMHTPTPELPMQVYARDSSVMTSDLTTSASVLNRLGAKPAVLAASKNWRTWAAMLRMLVGFSALWGPSSEKRSSCDRRFL